MLIVGRRYLKYKFVQWMIKWYEISKWNHWLKITAECKRILPPPTPLYPAQNHPEALHSTAIGGCKLFQTHAIYILHRTHFIVYRMLYFDKTKWCCPWNSDQKFKQNSARWRWGSRSWGWWVQGHKGYWVKGVRGQGEKGGRHPGLWGSGSDVQMWWSLGSMGVMGSVF